MLSCLGHATDLLEASKRQIRMKHCTVQVVCCRAHAGMLATCSTLYKLVGKLVNTATVLLQTNLLHVPDIPA